MPIPRALYLYRNAGAASSSATAFDPFLQSMRDGSKEPAPASLLGATTSDRRHDFHLQLDGAARRLFARSASVTSTTSSSSLLPIAADAVSGSTILVILLDATSSPSYALSAARAAEHLNRTSTAAGVLLQASLTAVVSLASSAVLPTLQLVVQIGSKRCEVLFVSADGTSVHVQTPAFSELCPNGVCPEQHLPILLQYESSSPLQPPLWWQTALAASTSGPPPAAAVASALSSSPSFSTAAMPGPPISCPPWCPSLLPPNLEGIVPVAVASQQLTSSMGMVVPGRMPGEAVEALSTVSATAAAGLFYTPQCQGFTSIASGACTNFSDPRSQFCAFGSGDNCRPCPTVDGERAALCPGGSLLYPLASFYGSPQTGALVSRCDPPAAERCLGYTAVSAGDGSNGVGGGVLCGERYKQGSYACGACDAPRYYRASDGSCERCPAISETSAIGSILRTVGVFAAAAIALAAGVGLLAWTAVKAFGGSFGAGSRRMVSLVAWIVSLLQVLAQAARTASPGLPDYIQGLFSILALFQFQNVASPSECVQGSYAFFNEVLQLVLALALSFYLAVYLGFVHKGLPSGAATASKGGTFVSRTWATTQRQFPVLCLMTATLLFPLVTNTALELVACQERTLSPSALSALDGYEVESSGATGLVAVSLLTSNPSFVCWSGSHKPAGVLAVITLFVYSVGFPLLTVCWAWRRLGTLLRAEDAERKRSKEVVSSSAEDDAASWAQLLAADAASLKSPRVSRLCLSWLLCCCGRQRGWKIGSGNESIFSVFCCLNRLCCCCCCCPSKAIIGLPAPSPAEKPLAFPLQLDAVASGALVPADGITVITDDLALAHFFSQYRASMLEMRSVDLFGIAALAVIDVFWPKALTSAPAAVARGTVYTLFLLALAFYTWSRDPVSRLDNGHKWQGPVQVLSLVIAALASILTHTSLAFSISASSSSSGILTPEQNQTVQALSFLLIVSCLLLFVVLVLGFIS